MRTLAKLRVPFHMHAAGWVIPAFCILIGVELFGFRLGPIAGALLLASLLMHEVGHMAAAISLRVPVREFGLCLIGAYNRRARASRRRDEMLISAAGPAMNLLLVYPLFFIPRIGPQIALCNLLLGVVNLVPLPSSDGLRILRNLWGSPASADTGPMIPALSQSKQN